ncbi:hypothetical protein OROHE_007579 [Orobanche hederae]
MEKGIKSDIQTLFYGGLELLDSGKLSDYSIGEGSIVGLSLNPGSSARSTSPIIQNR